MEGFGRSGFRGDREENYRQSWCLLFFFCFFVFCFFDEGSPAGSLPRHVLGTLCE